MSRPAIFFDRDNTLIVSDGYLGDPAGVTLVRGAADAVARAKSLGFAVVVFSNQSGVARGMFTEEAVHAVNARLDELLGDDDPRAVIDRHEYCPYHPEATVEQYRQDSDLRKPRPGMIYRAADALDLDLMRSWVIGDAPRDVEAGYRARCRTVLFRDPELPASPAAEEEMTVAPDATVTSLQAALDLIESAAAPDPADFARAGRDAGVPDRHPPADAPPAIDPQSSTSPSAYVAEPAALAPVEVRPVEPVSDPIRPVPEPGLPPEDARPAAVVPPPEPDYGAHDDDGGAGGGSETVPAPAAVDPARLDRLEKIASDILIELRHRGRHDHGPADFSVSKLLAGVVQALALAAMILAYFSRDNHETFVDVVLVAIMLETLTVALLLMGRDAR